MFIKNTKTTLNVIPEHYSQMEFMLKPKLSGNYSYNLQITFEYLKKKIQHSPYLFWREHPGAEPYR